MAIQLLKETFSLSDSDVINLYNVSRKVSVAKGEHLYSAGENFPYLALVLEGFLYSYYMDEKDQEIVKKFCWPGKITAPFTSFISESRPTLFSAKALEDSEVLIVDYKEIKRLVDVDVIWSKRYSKILEESILERETREYEMLCLPLKNRYESLMKRSGEYLKDVPQYLIASYLSVKPGSLSRIKNQDN